jgi:DNA-binding NarL/FixJ family response regulator
VRTVANGEAVLAPTVARRLITTFAALPPALVSTPDLAECTPRERSVLLLVAKGRPNRQIAKRLSVSESSVKITVNRVLTRLKLENRVQAALFVFDRESAGVDPRQPDVGVQASKDRAVGGNAFIVGD